jgi:hypothetical protein
MMGVDPDQAGSGSVQAAPSDFDQRIGRFVSLVVPFNCGPRHCGQLSASTCVAVLMARMITLTVNLFRETTDVRIMAACRE